MIVSNRFARSYLGGIAVNDRLVLRDPSTGRSVGVTVSQLANLPPWAGDVVTSLDVLTSVETERRRSSARSAIAVSTAPAAVVKTQLAPTASTASTATVSVRPASPASATLDASIVAWLRRVALVILAMGIPVGIALRSTARKPVRPIRQPGVARGHR